MPIAFLKIALTAMLLWMFVCGLTAIQSGRVYCKGLWYERGKNSFGFWTTIALYIVGPPILLFIVWTV
jgi:hypothetical protein